MKNKYSNFEKLDAILIVKFNFENSSLKSTYSALVVIGTALHVRQVRMLN